MSMSLCLDGCSPAAGIQHAQHLVSISDPTCSTLGQHQRSSSIKACRAAFKQTAYLYSMPSGRSLLILEMQLQVVIAQ